MQEQEKKTVRGRRAKQAETKTENATPVTTAEKETMKEETNAAPAAFTMEQVQKMIADAIAQHDKERKPEAPATQSGSESTVTMFFQAEVNDANELLLGPNGKYGMITGKHATITVPKRDFIGEFRTAIIQYYLKTRNLIVVDGLTDEERKIYGLDYQDGEYLEPAVYERLIEMGDKVLEIFPKLHVTWREMIATKFLEAFENKTLRCSREALIRMNNLSKKDYKDLPAGDERRKGAFYPIIHAMNAADETDDEA
jgi:hypothetical protein